jgi:hypothetical protein
MASKREKELEAIVEALVPAARDILWCALVWNDHNFDYKEFQAKADRAAKSLGYDRKGLGSAIDEVNAWLDRVDRALGVAHPTTADKP